MGAFVPFTLIFNSKTQTKTNAHDATAFFLCLKEIKKNESESETGDLFFLVRVKKKKKN